MLFDSEKEEPLPEEIYETPGVRDVPWHPGVLKIANVNREIVKMAQLCQELYASMVTVQQTLETIVKVF